MKKDIAEKWVAALRSGEYTQGYGGLKQYRDGVARHCCLGVLCEVLGILEEPSSVPEHVKFDDNTAYISEKVKRLVGLSTHDGELSINPYNSLVYMNDHGATFEEIATVIETNWEKL